MPYYYPETDGRVFLVKKEGKLRFPTHKDEMDFQFQLVRRMRIDGKDVLYGIPRLDFHPTEWISKDQIPLRDEVDKFVRKAVNVTLPRIVVEAIIRKEGKIMLVKPTRGYNKGQWTLPGGFLLYGEDPKVAVKREIEEETNAKVSLGELLNLYGKVGHNLYHWIILYYYARLEDGGESLEPRHEIEEIGWFAPDEVSDNLGSPLMAEGFEQLVDDLPHLVTR